MKLHEENINAEIAAICEYNSQDNRDYLSEAFIFSLAKTHGVQIGCKYTDAFEVIQLFI